MSAPTTDRIGAATVAEIRLPDSLHVPVTVDGDPAMVVGFNGPYVMVLFDGAAVPVAAHHTWHVEHRADRAVGGER